MTDTIMTLLAVFSDFYGKLIDSTNWKLLLCKWLEVFGGVAQLVRAWDS